MKQNENTLNINIRDLMFLIISKSWIILISFIVFSTITGIYSYTRLNDYYSANATIYLGRESSIGSIDLGTISLNNQLMGDYINLIKSRLIAEEVAKRIEHKLPVEIIQAGLQAYSLSTPTVPTRMFNITYQNSDPELAATVVNAVCEVVITKADEVMGIKNAQIIDKALTPKHPMGPNRRRNIVLSGAIGIVIGILIILVIDFIDQTFKKPEDVEKILGLTVLGTIPAFKGSKR